MVNRDPDTIKQEIDQARDQLAATVDSLAERANPQRLADDAKAVGQLQDTNLKGIYDLKILNELLKAQNQPEVKGL